MKNKLKSKTHRAFTLVEVLLAVVILEIGLLGVAAFYAKSISITRVARNETTASNLASGLLDEYSELSYDNLPVGDGSQAPYEGTDFPNFSKKVDVAYIDSNLALNYVTDTNMKKITVTISWQEQNSPRSFQITTIKAKH